MPSHEEGDHGILFPWNWTRITCKPHFNNPKVLKLGQRTCSEQGCFEQGTLWTRNISEWDVFERNVLDISDIPYKDCLMKKN